MAKFNPKHAQKSAFAQLLEVRGTAPRSIPFKAGNCYALNSGCGLSAAPCRCLEVGRGMVHFAGQQNEQIWQTRAPIDSLYPGKDNTHTLGTGVVVTYHSRGSTEYSQLVRKI